MNKRDTILVVDDEPVGLSVLSRVLSKYYQVQTAESGYSALSLIKQRQQPDLILLDICMPGLSGLDICRQLKQQAHTQAIPIIFLTAKTSLEDEANGLNAGAVDFLKKPFRPVTDLKRIQIHLDLAEQIKQARHSNDPPDAVSIPPQPSFKDKMTDLVYLHISDSQYSVEQLATDMCMSRETLARNCKKNTLPSPLNYIRQVRMSEAKRLLINGENTITQVCYLLGYESLSYFSKRFKQFTGLTPSDFVSKHTS